MSATAKDMSINLHDPVVCALCDDDILIEALTESIWEMRGEKRKPVDPELDDLRTLIQTGSDDAELGRRIRMKVREYITDQAERQ